MNSDFAYFDLSSGIENLIANNSPHNEQDFNKKDGNKIEPVETETVLINLGTSENPKEIKIGSNLSQEEKKDLMGLLKEFQEVFAWSYEDMLGINLDNVQHRIPTLSEVKPVKQKLCCMKPKWMLKIKEEVVKQLKVSFIKAVEWTDWVANIVLVPKKDGCIWMWVDFRDLNKACPKDDFPLPHIDVLVDNTKGSALMSFMDGFSGYNQIQMAPKDMTKTTFVMEWGIYCYTIMPFGLKNASATYQRMATTLLHDMMHKEVEVYVDDMIVKFKTREEHPANLHKFFERIRDYKLRLNLQKCTFGVTTGKLLGHMVSSRGI
jgi:hypothetical protein